MYNLDEILIQSVKVRASDIHLTTGRPPSYRIDGVLAPIEGERLTPQMLEDILMPLMDVRHREELQNNGQTDFAYAISGVGRFHIIILSTFSKSFTPIRRAISNRHLRPRIP